MKNIKVSNNVIRRLPRYLRKLDELQYNGVQRVSSAELGSYMGFTSSQIRQDFSHFGEFGQQGYGYSVGLLRNQIATILGMDRNHKAILVGTGNIGRALMDNFCFSEWGIDLIAAFDVDEDMIGIKRNGVEIYDAATLFDFMAGHHVDIAVLAVPSDVARQVADNLIALEIRAIWNFTNVDITEPHSNVIVENMHFSDSLMALNYYVSEKDDSMVCAREVGGV